MCVNNEDIRSAIFDEIDLSNLEDIKKKLFDDENDPRSLSYVRKNERPIINWWLIVLNIIIPIMIAGSIIYIAQLLGIMIGYSILLGLILLLAYFLLKLKSILICMVKIYQSLAPDHIRNKCRFEPSCSNYMILAIEKYGLIKGVKKGINRIKRCNVNNGGYDWP